MNAKELSELLRQVIDENFDGSIHEFLEVQNLDEETVAQEEADGASYAENDRAVLNAVGSIEQVYEDFINRDVKRTVYHFKDHDVYLGLDGRYSSWDGTDYSHSWFEVKPEQETRTVYKKVGKK